MSKERSRTEKLTITVSATVMGLLAGILSYISIPDVTSTASLLLMFGATITSIGISRTSTDGEFSKKDYAFIIFMVSSFWFISWTTIVMI